MPKIDVRVPHIARVYDYWLGGRDNFAADRELGERTLAAYPNLGHTARANRAFLARATWFLAHDMGIRQFLDIGTGLPSSNNMHEVAQRAAVDSTVVYADNDPLVMSHARALLKSAPGGTCAYLEADLREPETILAAARQTLDFSMPVAVMMIAVLHFVEHDDCARSIVGTLLDGCPPGSFVAISHAAGDIEPDQVTEMARRANEALRDRLTLRDHASVAGLFGAAELVEPGVVAAPQWRPHYPAEGVIPAALWAGVGRRG